MKRLGLKNIKLTRILLPKDMPKRIKSDNAKGIAESAWHERIPIGIIHPPTVRRVEGKEYDFVLIAGGDRIAAAINQKVDSVECMMVECSDEEFEVIQINENHRRRDDTEKRDNQLLRLESIYSAKHAAKVASGEEKPGAKRTKAAVRKEVAKATGLQPESVRKAQQRARKRNEQAVAKSQPVAEPEEVEVIETFGIPLQREWLQKIGDLQMLLERGERYLSNLKGALTQIATQELPFPPARLQAMQASASELYELVSSLVPRSLCPYCKGQDGLQQQCAACVDLGYITEGQLDYPKELRNPNKVLVNGRVEDLPEEGDEPEPQGSEEAAPAEPELADDDPFGGLEVG